jgi:hypothetical protein
MERYKFQAVVTLDQPQDSGQGAGEVLRSGHMQRYVLRSEHHQTHASQIFSALVTNNGDAVARPLDDHVVVTVLLLGDEPREYFDIGDQFALWLGQDVGHGVVTRRLFI